MVERYLIKKSLMKPLQAYQEVKRLKSLELKNVDPGTAAIVKELKTQFSGFEQFFLPKTCPGSSSKTPSTAAQSVAEVSMKPKLIVKEVCCCYADKKIKNIENVGDCLRKKANSSPGKNGKQAQTEESAAKLNSEKEGWKHILMKVKNRRRLESGQMSNVI